MIEVQTGRSVVIQIPEELPHDALLRRAQVAEALQRAGFPVAAKSLATMATRGGGPPFSKFGHYVLYRWGDALAWAQGRLSAPRRSTSEPLNTRHCSPSPCNSANSPGEAE